MYKSVVSIKICLLRLDNTHHGLDIEAARTSESKWSQNFTCQQDTGVPASLKHPTKACNARASLTNKATTMHSEFPSIVSGSTNLRRVADSVQPIQKVPCWFDLNLQFTWSFTTSGWDAQNRLVEEQELLPREPWYLENPELDRPVCGLQSTKCLNKTCANKEVFSAVSGFPSSWPTCSKTNDTDAIRQLNLLRCTYYMLGLISLISCSLSEYK